MTLYSIASLAFKYILLKCVISIAAKHLKSNFWQLGIVLLRFLLHKSSIETCVNKCIIFYWIT